jgi:hypothetical protein
VRANSSMEPARGRPKPGAGAPRKSASATASRRLQLAPSEYTLGRGSRRAASLGPHAGRVRLIEMTLFGPSDCTYALIGDPLRHSASQSQSFATIPGGASRTLARAIACAHASWAPAPATYASSSRSICGEQRPNCRRTVNCVPRPSARLFGALAGATGRIIVFSRPRELTQPTKDQHSQAPAE